MHRGGLLECQFVDITSLTDTFNLHWVSEAGLVDKGRNQPGGGGIQTVNF